MLFHILLDLILILKKPKKYWIFQLCVQRIMNLPEKTLNHWYKQQKGINAQIFLYLLFWDVF